MADFVHTRPFYRHVAALLAEAGDEFTEAEDKYVEVLLVKGGADRVRTWIKRERWSPTVNSQGQVVVDHWDSPDKTLSAELQDRVGGQLLQVLARAERH